MKNLLVCIILFSSLFSHASMINIKGVVSEKNGTPMPYVIIELYQKSAKLKSTASNQTGQYSFSDIPSGVYDLKFKFIGFETLTKSNLTITSTSLTTINVQMVEELKNLEEVKVISKKTVNTEVAYGVSLVNAISADESISYTWSAPTTTNNKISYRDSYKIPVVTGAKTVYDQYDIADIEKDIRKNDNINYSEAYNEIIENKFINSNENATSTFSIDVDNASYSNIRRMISYNQMPPKNAVRIEEMINYFKYDYAKPTGNDPFAVNTEIMSCPWNTKSKILLIGMQGKQLNYAQINPSNLVFLVDVSGSMSEANKLPLVKQSLKILVDNLQANDKIALVVYAGNAGLVLPSTAVKNKEVIYNAIDNLSAGGSTAGGAGIKLAYKIAEENMIAGGNNRVVMCTDGDFNVGVSSNEEMKKLIEEERNKKIYITMCGFGMGNYKDDKMETIADNGNGNYFYIDNLNEANKVFKTDMKATLFTIAKDVKLQLYFNPNQIASYRLIGYENRMLAKEDFDNDKKDAGELGAGHTVTALYEVVLKDNSSTTINLNKDLTKQLAQEEINFNQEDYLILKMRYKNPDDSTSHLMVNHLDKSNVVEHVNPSDNIKFASSVAWYGMLLRESSYIQKSSYLDVLALAESSKGNDNQGYRKEFIDMVKSTNLLAKK